MKQMPQTLVGMDLPEIQQMLGSAQPVFRARQIFGAFYKQKVRNFSEVSNLPKDLRNDLQQHEFGLPEVDNFFDSVDGTRRYLLRLRDNRTVETVLMPEEGRDTICISTQVGCPVDCKFCLTALMGLERSLTAGEIVGQVLFVMKAHQLSTGVDRLNIVMMGMGEPLLNLPNVLKATRILVDPV